jgi:quercetin dioxygenase-like cupin family protein
MAAAALLALGTRMALAQQQQAAPHDHREFACQPNGLASNESAGCQLLSRPVLTKLPDGPVYWRLTSFSSRAKADAAKRDGDAVVSAAGRLWLSSLGPRGDTSLGGTPVASIGPLLMPKAGNYQVELFYVIMPPQMHTQVHTHQGPEAWYILEGEQCLETPAGTARGRAGQNLVGPPGGTPMQLSNNGKTRRRALFIVVHDSSNAWVTPSDWKPTGGCKS